MSTEGQPEDNERFSGCGLVVCAIPAAGVVLHLVWPDIFWLKMVSMVCVLFFGAVLLSAVAEGIAGRRSFSLPAFNILLVTAVGGVLSYWYGWVSTGIVLAAYCLLCLLQGILARNKE